MKSLTKLTSAVVLLALVLTAFPALGAGTARAAACDWAGFVADVTVPDGTFYAPGTTFTKTWRLKNIGYCPWNVSYALVFDSGEQMGAPTVVNFPKNVAPGETVDLSVDMTAPSSAGHYRSYWKLRNDKNVIFGIGYYANRAFWAEINVSSSSSTGFDFTASAKDATWSSGAGALTFPGTDGDAKGFVVKLDKPKFESGVELDKPGLLMAPQNVYNGYIQAVYKPYHVKAGDRFQARIGCEYNATNCYVAYRLDYRIGNGPVRTYWSFREKYEGLTYNVNLNLNPLAGYDVTFILIVSAYGNATGDRALWGNPVITGTGGPVVTITPTATGPTPTATSTLPSPSSCDKVKFIKDVSYPDGSSVTAGTEFNKTWRLLNYGTCTWTTSYQLVFYSGEKMGGPDSLAFPKEVKPGQTVDITVTLKAPAAAGSYRGNWMFKNDKGQLFGIGAPQYNKPWWVDIKVGGTSGTTTTPTATPTVTATSGTGPSTKTPTPTATATEAPLSNWNTYRNLNYSFLFKFPPGSVVSNHASDINARIYLPLVEQGTNLGEKYAEVNVIETTDPCKSLNPGAVTSDNVTINNIPFLKETGSDAGAGNRYDWVSYSTSKDNACINVSFVLHSTNPGNYPTPPPEFDEATESAVFDTIMSTFGFIK